MTETNVILIGAGRGMRLMPYTESEPKSFTVIAGRRILDWTLDAFRTNGLGRFVFIGGYLIDSIRAGYPEFDVTENKDWANNNILFSLMHAREHMAQGFYASYTDTLFRPSAVAALKDSPHDITLAMDTAWRERYRFRSQHPETDAEKMIADGDRVTTLSRDLAPEQTTGEFTGVMRMTATGAAQFVEHFDRLYGTHGQEGIFVGKPFRMAYLLHQLEHMVQDGVEVHCAALPGEYYEIDTVEDYHLAKEGWEKYAAT
jgi:choline kinase